MRMIGRKYTLAKIEWETRSESEALKLEINKVKIRASSLYVKFACLYSIEVENLR
jgi:hypothetical protein